LLKAVGKQSDESPSKDTNFENTTTAVDFFEPVNCGCDSHLETIDVDTILNISAKDLFEILFGNDCLTFWKDMDEITGTTSTLIFNLDRKDGGWSIDPIPSKIVTSIVPTNNPLLKSKETNVTSEYYIKKKDHLK
jgi:hypothetical protein